METSKNQQTQQSNTTTLDKLAEQKFPIKPTDCWMVRRKKLWQREQFIKEHEQV